MIGGKDKNCPACRSKDIIQSYIYAHGDKYECKNCGKLWGWYYDRNKPENKNKTEPYCH